MSTFKHGTYSKEQESKIKGILSVKQPVVVIGTAPINMGDLTCVNKAQLINTETDAQTYFGGTNNIEGFTISEALYTAFKVFGVTPVICINVLDPNIHKTAHTEEAVAVVEKRVTLEKIGIIPDSIVLKRNDTSVEITDASYTFDAEGKCIVILATSDIAKVDIEYDFLDPSKVKDSDIIGSIDPVTLKPKGMECLKEIFSRYSMIPSYVITPGYNSNEVRTILDTKAQLINNKWGSMSIVDMPEATAYGEAIEFKKSNNWIDEDQILCYGKVRFGGKLFYQSIFAAFLSASVDAGNDGVPYESPSNKNIKGNGISYKAASGKYEELDFTEDEANLLNENGICTVLSRPNGIVFWGNMTSIFQPGGSTDPKDMWLPIKRMFKYVANTIKMNYDSEVDKPMTPSRIANIKMNINTWLNSLTQQGKILGGRVEFLEEENSPNDMILGNFKWHIYIGGVIPGQALEFILEYDAGYLSEYYAA